MKLIMLTINSLTVIIVEILWLKMEVNIGRTTISVQTIAKASVLKRRNQAMIKSNNQIP